MPAHDVNGSAAAQAPGLWDTVKSWMWGEEPSPAQPVATGAGGAPQQAADVMSHYAEPELGVPTPRTPSPPGKENVVYLGINDASREKEKEAFKGVDNATVITGAGTNKEMQGKVMAADGKTVLDLGKEADLQKYLDEVGVGAVRTGVDGKPIETAEDAQKRTQALKDVFLGQKDKDGQRQGGLDVGVRDEMAQFLKVLQKVEGGEMNMDHIVMSGHSTGEWVYSEADGSPGVRFDQMAQLMSQFPQAQAGVKDLMLSACHTLENGAVMDNRDGKQYQEMFPNLESVWGYNGYSPSYKQGSTQHIRSWLKASQGDDAGKVAQAARRQGQNATAKEFE